MKDTLLGFVRDDLLSGDFDLSAEDNMLADGMIDSVGVIRLVAYIDQQFGYRVPHEDLTIQNFRSISALVDYLETCMPGAGA